METIRTYKVFVNGVYLSHLHFTESELWKKDIMVKDRFKENKNIAIKSEDKLTYQFAYCYRQ